MGRISSGGMMFKAITTVAALVIVLIIAAIAAVAWKLVGKKAAEAIDRKLQGK